jgi:hypothetical protein
VDWPGKVYIFDGVDADDASSMHERVAACYGWAEEHGAAVLDEIISWAPRFRSGRVEALAAAVTACRRDRASLLVYSASALPEGSQALASLDAVPLWTAVAINVTEQQQPARSTTAVDSP